MWDDLEMRDIVLLVHYSLILRPRSPPVQLIVQNIVWMVQLVYIAWKYNGS